MDTGEVRWASGFLWCGIVAVLCAAPAEWGKHREEELKRSLEWETVRTGSLQNIDRGSQTMMERNFSSRKPPPHHAFTVRKVILALTPCLCSYPSGALIHIFLRHCDPRGCLDCKAQEVVCALGALRICYPPTVSESDPRKLANRYDFIVAGASSFKLLKGPYVLTDCCLPRDKRWLGSGSKSRIHIHTHCSLLA